MEFVNFMPEEAFRQKVESLFEQQKNRLQSLLPEADIQHIGSTAIPNSLTKGDLDIQVRIPAELFTVAVNKLSKIYDTNDGSHRSATFAAFKDDTLDPPLGVQLTAIGGEEDFFWKLRDFFKAHDKYRLEYDNLKKQFEGKSMDEYIEAKGQFIEKLMQTEEFLAL